MATYKQCKYCMKRITEEEMGVFQCAKCTVLVHERCCVTTATTSHRASHLKGDYLFVFECRECAYTRSDTFTRMKLTWVQLIHFALYNLTVNETGRQGYFRWKEDICRFIDHNWTSLMPGRDKSPAMAGTVAGALSIHGKLFKSGAHIFHENGWWALQRVSPPISNAENYKMFKSNSPKSISPASVSGGLQQKRGAGRCEVSAADIGTDELIYGRGKRQRSVKEKKKKDTTAAAAGAKVVKIESGGSTSTTKNGISIHASHNSNNSKNDPIKGRNLPEKKSEPNLGEFCSLTDSIQLNVNNNSNSSSNSNNGDSNNNNVDQSVVIKTEPTTCFDSFPPLDSYDRKVAQENGLFPFDDDNPFSMEYSPEDIADFIPPMFDEKSEFDKIVEEFKEYNAQRENSLKGNSLKENTLSGNSLKEKSLTVNVKENNPRENRQQQRSPFHQDSNIKQDTNSSNKNLLQNNLLQELPEVQLETTKETAKASVKTEVVTEEREREEVKDEGLKSVKKEASPQRKNEKKTVMLSVKEEAFLLSKLNEFEFVLSADPSLRRLRRKLLVRKMKREKGHKIFSLQESCDSHARKDAPPDNLDAETKLPEQKSVPSAPAGESVEFAKSEELLKQGYHHPALRDVNVLDRFLNFTHQVSDNRVRKSIYVRLVGNSDGTITSRSITSPYTSRVLKPYIRRDFQSLPRKLKLLREIQNHPKNKNKTTASQCTWPIDYCYVQPHHLPAVNALCSDFFWPGIEMTEALQYPEFSCVVVYRKLVIGFAFMVPDVKYNEAYISFILVHPDWQRANIGTNMMYHLIQTCMGKDITLHVSPTNTSLLFYQKFGFKAEKLLLGFYNKYLPEGDTTCPHAFVLRLRR